MVSPQHTHNPMDPIDRELFETGLELLEAGKYQAAIEIFRGLQARYPDNREVAIQLIQARRLVRRTAWRLSRFPIWIFYVISMAVAVAGLLCVGLQQCGMPYAGTPTTQSIVWPSATFTPTFEPTSTFTPTPKTRPVEIAALNVRSEIQVDGTVKKTAQLSIDPLGVGNLQLTAPARIKLGQSGIVRLIIIPDTALTSLPQVALASLSIDSPGLAGEPDYALRFSDRIQIYPVMIAELRGANFDIVSDDQPAKPVVSSLPVEWIWLVMPKVGGEQTLVLYISIPVLIDETKETISAQPLKNIPIRILVEVTPTPTPSQTPSPTLTPTPTPTFTPTPTPTPLPIARRIGDQLISNSAIILVALIGLLGTSLTAYSSIQNSKRQTRIEDLKRQIEHAESEKDLEALKSRIVHLESIRWWQFWRR